MKKNLLSALAALFIVSLSIAAPYAFYKPVKVQYLSTLKNTGYNVRVTVGDSESGSIDAGTFSATNLETGEVYYEIGEYRGGFHELPVYFSGLPAGTYRFDADRGQGGWTAIESKVVTIAPGDVDADGFINVNLKIAWSE